jgi:circadian clock protein KaiC
VIDRYYRLRYCAYIEFSGYCDLSRNASHWRGTESMKSDRSRQKATAVKAASGISGFDGMTGGGLPLGRTTLLVGGPGSGKTIFTLQFLIHGARHCREPGIFVAFEESPRNIVANLVGFGWDVDSLMPKKLFFMDAHPSVEMVQVGDFDIGGMLASLGGQADKMGARRIAFDSLDIVLALLPDDAARRREVYRLHEWLLSRRLTGVITAKAGNEDAMSPGGRELDFMQFMVDCSVILNHRVVLGTSQRNLRVQKYRGSSFDENEAPFVISEEGFDVATSRTLGREGTVVAHERVSSGVKRLDTMLGGGFYRGASVLITGLPGAAKTTLSGAFTEAACRRGERTLFVSFDADSAEVVRNLVSVGIRLDRFAKRGILRMITARTIIASAETLLVRIKALAKEHRARCLVIDPISTLSRAGNELTAHNVAERLIDWTKAHGITLLCTSLLDEAVSQVGLTPLQISALSDTWIHLNYLVQSGERNRGLSIVKSRGTAHSNQVRELVLRAEGITLTDIYTAGGDVLMGTLRWEKENALRGAEKFAEVEGRLKGLKIAAEEAELQARLRSVRTELQAKQVERTLLTHSIETKAGERKTGRARIQLLRRGDAIAPAAK